MTPQELGNYALSVLAAVIFCGLIPVLLLPYLMRAFSKRPFMLVKNYAGRLVPLGLGFVWPLWGCAVVIFELVAPVVYNGLPPATSPDVTFFSMGPIIGFAVAACAAFAFGFIDDVGGAGESKGFKGHLKALAHGKVTTGFVKLLGIGAAALLLAYFLISQTNPAPFGMYSGTLAWWIVVVILMGGSIALSANFVNLCDLRPGRATKVSITMLVIGLIIGVASLFAPSRGLSMRLGLIHELGTFLIFLLPMLITLRYDLRERGMLGDAGANPAGLIAGAYITTQLGLVGLIIFLVIMLALNLVSEKLSFTQLIEKNPLLSRLDQIGRIKQGK